MEYLETVEKMREEILNIHHHRIRLMITSLNSSKTLKDAAEKCGIHERTMRNFKRNYNIKKVDGVYRSVSKPISLKKFIL